MPLGGHCKSPGPHNSLASQSYNGQFTTAIDESNVQTVSQNDALGRLKKVTVSGLDTLYSYDVLDDLLQVSQAGQIRTFEYDSLKRLKKACNPESVDDEFKGFFFGESDAQSFGARMSQMTGDQYSVVSGEAPTGLVDASPPHTAATEGPGVLIKSENLPQVKVKQPNQ